MKPDAEGTRVAMTLDMVGLFCPEQVLQGGSRINDIEVGEALVLLADDPSARSDIRSWAKRTGQEILAVEDEDGVTKFTIRRTG